MPGPTYPTIKLICVKLPIIIIQWVCVGDPLIQNEWYTLLSHNNS